VSLKLFSLVFLNIFHRLVDQKESELIETGVILIIFV